jgi:4-amino-4-deoxy-L-arabinose transferase-like glycosyltransferase
MAEIPKSEFYERSPFRRSALLKLFFAALAIRWTYSLTLFASMGEKGLTGVDSSTYLHNAEVFATNIIDSTSQAWFWIGPDPTMMPLFTWLLTLNALIAGKYAAITFALIQGAIDAVTCLLVYALAKAIDQRIALTAAIVAAVNPTQIVLAAYVYSDTLFLFFVALLLVGSAQYLRQPSWRSAGLMALGLGGAVMSRELALLWGAVLPAFMLVALTIRHQFRLTHLAQLVTVGFVLAFCVAPIILRNHYQYASWALTPKTGMHLSRWIVPLVRETKDGTPWAVGVAETERRTIERFGPNPTNPFELSRRYTAVSIDELRRLGVAAMAKAWLAGAAINLGAPAIILSPPVMALPRTGFYATTGGSILEKIGKFLFHSDNRIYAWVLLLGIAGLAAIRIVQLIGMIELFGSGGNIWILLMLAGWCIYILTVNGPVASPKYRLPIEPVFAVLTAAGFRRVLRRA